MTTALVALFLVAHGLVHLAVWLPHPEPDPAKPAPFAPDHSGVLTMASVAPATAHRLAVVLAVGAAATFVAAGGAVAIGADWAVPMAVIACVLGLTLKLVYFNPWLLIGIALDLLVLAAALAQWPVSLV